MTSCEWTAEATAENARDLRKAAVAFAADNFVPTPPILELELAVAEAINNTVVHAFTDRAVGSVTVALDIDEDQRRVCVRVTDDGTGMRPRTDSPGLGVGLPLMMRLADSVDFREPAHARGTEVALTFNFDRDSVMH